MRRILLASTFVSLLSTVGLASGVHLVGSSGAASFGTIQGAVEAAQEGDLILVSEGTYAGFSVWNKGLRVIGAPGQQVTIVSGVVIGGLPAGSLLLLSGLEIEGVDGQDAIRATGCDGWLRIQECEVRGGRSTFEVAERGVGLRLVDCAGVSIESSILHGGLNERDGSPFPGSSGMEASGSTVSAHAAQFYGGHGSATEGPCHGGHGALLSNDSWCFAAESTFRGGSADHGCESGPDAFGGSGVVLVGQVPVHALACSFLGGSHLPGGCLPSGTAPPVVGCCVQDISAAPRSVRARRVTADRQPIDVEFRGVPGDRAYLLASTDAAFEWAPALSGVWAIERPSYAGALPLGVVPGSGLLTAQVLLPTLAPGSVRGAIELQAYALSSSGTPVLGNWLSVQLLEQGAGPDCDADGRSDLVATLDGLVPDLNRNLVPDACEWGGPDWFVDAGAAVGGNGSAAAPFQTLGRAFSQASSGHRILVSPGIYAGGDNRDLDYAGRNLEVIGLAGAQGCVIDCEQLGRGFLFRGGTLESARLEGFTVRNGRPSFPTYGAEVGRGGGIYVGTHARPEIAACVIENCAATESGPNQGQGGGLYVDYFGNPRVIDTIFRGNQARKRGGGISVLGRLRLSRCVLVDNAVTQDNPTGSGEPAGGGGIYLIGGLSIIDQCVIAFNTSAGQGGGLSGGGNGGPTVLITHSKIVQNSALRGGGLYGDVFTSRIENCLVAGNLATEGGGVMYRLGALWIRGCTVVGNESAIGGAGFLRTQANGEHHIVNSIFWRNQAPGGIQIASVGATPGPLHVRYSFVGSGANGISGGNVHIGPGLLSGSPDFLDIAGPDGDPASFLDNDYRLAPGSICIDAGSNQDVGVDTTDIDGDGNTTEQAPLDLSLQPRFVDDPAAPDVGSGTPPLVDLGAHERQP